MIPSRGTSCASRASHIDVLDALDRQRARDDRGAHRVALGLVQRVDHRRALGWAHGDARLGVARRGGARRAEHAQVGELVLQGDRVGHRRLRVVGHRDHRVLGEELVDPAGRLAHARELQVGLRRATATAPRARACASTSRCRAATAAGSRTGRVRPCSWRRSPSGGRARPACPAPERQPVRREAKMSA